jgi:hypothetical protein
MNSLAKIMVIGIPMMAAATGVGLAGFYRSSYATGVQEVVPQPVPFSHMHHVGQLGIDCRYCHTSVETSAYAGVPPTKTCMNCHQQMWVGTEMLSGVRESYATDKPIQWNRVHNLPDYTYFNHSIHISKGVGCVSCHGQVNEMPLTFQSKTLLMEWCLKCHRQPEKHLRPKDEVFSMTWKIEDGGTFIDKDGKKQDLPKNSSDLGELLKNLYHVRDAKTMTSCSMCHR